MAIQIPTDPAVFFGTFVPTEFTRNTAGKALPHMPYSLSIELAGGGRHYYKVTDGKLTYDPAASAPEGDIRVKLSLDDFKELIRAAKSNAPDEPPPAPPIPPTYVFPPLEQLAGSFRIVIDDLGDKRTVDIAFGVVPAGAPLKATLHTTVDFVVGQAGKTVGVEQLLKSGGVKIEGDLGYLLRLASAFTGKTRRRER